MSVNEQALQSELSNFQGLLTKELEKGTPDPAQVEFYKNTINSLKAQLGEESEGEVTIAVSRTPFEFIAKFNFDEYAGIEGNMLNSIVQNFLNKKAEVVAEQYAERIAQLETELAGETETRINLEYQNRQHQGNIQLLSESNLALTEEKNRYKAEFEDYKSRFEAAAAALNEKDAEIERLKHREADLQEQIARMPAPTTRQIVDITADNIDVDALIRQANERKAQKAREEEEARKAKLIKVRNIRWDEPSRDYKLAELVLDGPTGVDDQVGKADQTIRFHCWNIGKYLEVSADDAARFRAEQAATLQTTGNSQEDPHAHIPVATPVEVPEITDRQFRSGDEDLEGKTEGQPDTEGNRGVENHEAVQETVSRSEFEALKADVEMLKQRVVA